MSKINALRIINLNYNNNSMRVDDETFRFDGESTLMSLRNGGGKSVLVQMMIAPFVHKHYRNTKDRPFSTFFTSNTPTFIMVEWALDGNQGYVLTGMMVRKNQAIGEAEEKEDLEIINFVSEYKGKCRCDINNLAVIEKSAKEKKLKSFGNCRQLFEILKKDSSLDFNYYDMSNSQQSKRYFEKLKEFQIDSREWETIIKKVNVKESGLSELFAEAKDEKGLIEKWFLEAVENKLNKDKPRIKEFERLVLKYIRQYKENQVKIQQKETIAKFEEETAEVSRKAGDYKLAADAKASYENRIANLIRLYETLKTGAELENKEIAARIAEIEEEIARIEYEERSLEIYRLEDKKDGRIKEHESLSGMKEKAEEEESEIERKLHAQECAMHYRDYQEASRDLQLCENKLELAREAESELEPERRMIGYNLRCRYEENRSQIEETVSALKKEIGEGRREEEELKVSRSLLEAEIGRLNVETGRLGAEIKGYDKAEGSFNQRFQESLQRNILGDYEPAYLEQKEREYADSLEKTSRQAADMHRRQEELNEKVNQTGRRLEDLNRQHTLCGEEEKRLQREIADYRKELDERKNIVKYVGLSEADMFDREKILKACVDKTGEIEEVRRSLEREYDKLEKECSRLKQGTVLELPKDFAAFLDNLGIHYVYGMEWLKKNGRTTAENEILTDSNPFIPYSIIVGKTDLEKLQSADAELYTSFPIPVIVREDLEKLYEKNTSCLIGTEKVSFFVMFNKNLLDPEKLSELIWAKEEEMDRKSGQIAIKNEERDFFTEKKELARLHKVEKGLFEKAVKDLAASESRKKELESEIDHTRDGQSALNRELSKVQDELPKLTIWISRLKDRNEEFKKLCTAYGTYIRDRKRLQKFQERAEEAAREAGRIAERTEQLVKQITDAEIERTRKKDELLAVSEKIAKFSAYAEGELSTKDTEDLEARFQAITEGISKSQQALEEDLEKARKSFEKSERQLLAKTRKYALEQTEYDSIVYDEFVENRLEEELKHKKTEVKELEGQVNKADRDIAVLENSIQTERKKMREKCGQEQPASRDAITETNFRAAINEKLAEKKQETGKAEKTLYRIDNYNAGLGLFAEYADFEIREELDLERELREGIRDGIQVVMQTGVMDGTQPGLPDEPVQSLAAGTRSFDTMSAEAFRSYNGMLRRDYNHSVKERITMQGRLRDELNRVARIEEFSEDFYKKPIEMIIDVIEEADAVLLQLNTILQSFVSLMDKLKADIAFIDRERDQVNELLFDYILEVHNNLGKIDKNSTINIRERNIRMLRLILPDWEENEALFAQRLKDFMDDLTAKALIAIDKNENIEELAGKRITTRNLYDLVVGIGSIEIKLYKIEEQREYPITWADVSKNSGGEGFLSAFVILTSLLYYMRRDDTDIFAEKEEGKVLVMDNPFAQTNASHLLKPLMDIAKKTNTQLICLSGLGGDSIYNRFDNIYVMNLVSSSARKVQYMKSEHIKGVGDETEEMVLSRVRIEDSSEEYYEQGRLF